MNVKIKNLWRNAENCQGFLLISAKSVKIHYPDNNNHRHKVLNIGICAYQQGTSQKFLY